MVTSMHAVSRLVIITFLVIHGVTQIATIESFSARRAEFVLVRFGDVLEVVGPPAEVASQIGKFLHRFYQSSVDAMHSGAKGSGQNDLLEDILRGNQINDGA